MKRSDLYPGLEVEVLQPGGVWQHAMVVLTEPWQRVTSFGHSSVYRFRPATSYTGNRQGLAVAIRHSHTVWDDPDHPQQRVTWAPAVVQLNTVFPVGTQEANRLAQRMADEETQAERKTREQRRMDLAKRLGLRRVELQYPYRKNGKYVDYFRVEIPIGKLEEMADYVESLEERLNLRVRLNPDAPKTVDS